MPPSIVPTTRVGPLYKFGVLGTGAGDRLRRRLNCTGLTSTCNPGRKGAKELGSSAPESLEFRAEA
jgi:hypothetical protein